MIAQTQHHFCYQWWKLLLCKVSCQLKWTAWYLRWSLSCFEDSLHRCSSHIIISMLPRSLHALESELNRNWSADVNELSQQATAVSSVDNSCLFAALRRLYFNLIVVTMDSPHHTFCDCVNTLLHYRLGTVLAFIFIHLSHAITIRHELFITPHHATNNEAQALNDTV